MAVDGKALVVGDPAGMQAGEGCAAVDAQTARCELKGVRRRLALDAGPGADLVRLTAAFARRASPGGDGDDRLEALVGGVVFDGGAGADTITGKRCVGDVCGPHAPGHGGAGPGRPARRGGRGRPVHRGHVGARRVGAGPAHGGDRRDCSLSGGPGADTLVAAADRLRPARRHRRGRPARRARPRHARRRPRVRPRVRRPGRRHALRRLGLPGRRAPTTRFRATATGARDRDVLAGGPGDDVLGPGPGRDTLTGGPGADAIGHRRRRRVRRRSRARRPRRGAGARPLARRRPLPGAAARGHRRRRRRHARVPRRAASRGPPAAGVQRGDRAARSRSRTARSSRASAAPTTCRAAAASPTACSPAAR